jgi:hypothetical protein
MGGHVKQLFDRAGAVAAIVGPALPEWRRLLVGAIMPTVLALWSSGAMAASADCAGATGTSTVTGTPAFLYLQCYKPIQIPGNPLQTFGGSALIRTNATTASYYLADRSNLGVDVVNAQLFKFIKTMTPPASSPFIGQLIWAPGPLTNPSTADSGRLGTSDESHSGPNGMAIYTDAEGFNWLFVADGACNATSSPDPRALPHGSSQATPSSAGTQGACGTPVDPSLLPNAAYQINTGGNYTYVPSSSGTTSGNCTPGNVPAAFPNGGCYPVYHQPNVKLFNLTNSTYVTCANCGGKDIITGGPGYGLGNYFGSSKADGIVIGTKSGMTYMLVSTPVEPFIPTAPQPTSGAYGPCDAPTKSVSYPIPPFTSKPTYVKGSTPTIGSFPYLTLFTIVSNSTARTANPPSVTYVATIRIDDTSPALTSFNGPYGPLSCDYDGKRPSTAISGMRYDPVAGLFFVALPTVFNNVPVALQTTFPKDFSGIGQGYIPDGPPGSPGALATNTGQPPPSGTVVGQGCVYQIGAVAQPNNSNSTQAGSGYFWTCDGGLAFFDPANITYDSPNVVNLTWWATGASQGVVKLPYCTPGSLSAGPYSSGSATLPPAAGADYDNLFLGCTPRLNGNTAGSAPGVTVSIAETYSAIINVHPKWFLGAPATAIPGPFPPTDNTSPFSKTIAFTNAGGTTANPTPLATGCTVQLWNTTCSGPGVDSYYQIPGGQIIGYPQLNTLYVNGASQARLFGEQSYGKGVSPGSVDMTTFMKDPHWYVAVGGAGFSAGNITTTLATKEPVLAYLDALSNQVIETTPTSSGSNTIAVDEQNYLAFLPVNGVAGQAPQLPAGDFTGNGVKLCGNGVVNMYGTVTGRGCVIVFRQQYLSPIGPRAP